MRLYFITTNEKIVRIVKEENRAKQALIDGYEVYQADMAVKGSREVAGQAVHSNVFSFGCQAGIRYRKVA
jgi:hypothetical protein